MVEHRLTVVYLRLFVKLDLSESVNNMKNYAILALISFSVGFGVVSGVLISYAQISDMNKPTIEKTDIQIRSLERALKPIDQKSFEMDIIKANYLKQNDILQKINN